MCKFTRSGGEVNAVAIRIARAYTKRQKVAAVVTMVGTIGTWQQILNQKMN